MTKDQEKLIDEASLKYIKDNVQNIPLGWDNAVRLDFEEGAKEVITNLKKYFPKLGEALGVEMVENLALREENERLKELLQDMLTEFDAEHASQGAFELCYKVSQVLKGK